MNIRFLLIISFCLAQVSVSFAQYEDATIELPKIHVTSEEPEDPKAIIEQYTIGVDDVLQISVIQPEQIINQATVSPDGFISFPYIGSLKAKDKTLTQVQEEIEQALSDGYMKYPTVSVVLMESRSRRFFVYGEVNKPGPYPLEENTTVLRAISMAGGFTKYGSGSRVKVLKPHKGSAGYEATKVNMADIMEGNSDKDLLLNSGDIVVVSEGVF